MAKKKKSSLEIATDILKRASNERNVANTLRFEEKGKKLTVTYEDIDVDVRSDGTKVRTPVHVEHTIEV